MELVEQEIQFFALTGNKKCKATIFSKWIINNVYRALETNYGFKTQKNRIDKFI